MMWTQMSVGRLCDRECNQGTRVFRPGHWAVMLVGVLLAWAGASPAVAHEGHAGKLLTFLETRESLREILPEDAHMVRRRQRLETEEVAVAQANHGVRPQSGLYTFYLARSGKGGAVQAAAMVRDYEYGHGTVKLIVGLGADGKLIRVGLAGLHSKYVGDLQASLPRGWLPGLAGEPIALLATRRDGVGEADSAGKLIYGYLLEMAAALHTLMRDNP